MISPNYSILKPTVFVLTSIYAKVFESPCASNLVQFRLLFTNFQVNFGKNGTRNFSLIVRHLESVSRTIPVFKHTLAPSEKWPTQEISVRFGPFLSSYRVNIARCNLCARAKVKGHIKLKIEENTFTISLLRFTIYDSPKLHHSSPNSFGANGHLHKKVCKTGKVIERSRDVTPRPKREKSKGHPRSPCAPNMVQFRPLFPELRHFEKNGTRLFF